MTANAKIWMKFLCSRPKVDLSDIRPIQAILVYVILQKKQVCIELCKRVGVSMEQLDKEMNPPKKLPGDDIYKQYIILQRKQKEERRTRRL
ncbi:hypothetical protein Gogos_006193 [Gossypium gossypioides]|uniref:Uncharacterized protein n=1 Tax=Gossypium gossypioides TaxID=34282 RepID=A0A7J9C522_GOSGO|nr:hypothetical protein [Gossypium gossypioides]